MVEHSTVVVASVIGREAMDGRTFVTIEAWEPFGAGLCDVRVRDSNDRVYWTGLHCLVPYNGSAFPRRGMVCTLRDRELLASLGREREALLREIREHKPWPGAEHGKAFIGRAIDGAIADVKRRLGE